MIFHLEYVALGHASYPFTEERKAKGITMVSNSTNTQISIYDPHYSRVFGDIINWENRIDMDTTATDTKDLPVRYRANRFHVVL